MKDIANIPESVAIFYENLLSENTFYVVKK